MADISQREKRMIAAAIVFVSVTAIYYLVVDPLLGAGKSIDSRIERKEQELVRIKSLAAEYARHAGQGAEAARRIRDRAAGFSAIAAVEELTRSAGLGEKIVSMGPQPEQPAASGGPFDGLAETSVDAKLRGVTLAELVTFLESVEISADMLRVKNASIKTQYDDPRLLDVTLVISTFVPAG